MKQSEIEPYEITLQRITKVRDYFISLKDSPGEQGLLAVAAVTSIVYAGDIIDGVLRKAIEQDNLYQAMSSIELQCLIGFLQPFIRNQESIACLKSICDFSPEFYDVVLGTRRKSP